MDIVWPVPASYKNNITQGFGGAYPAHDGIDFGVGAGNTTVACFAAAAGTVDGSWQWESSYGWHLRIDHGRGIKTMYCHLQRNSFRVKIGDAVEAGQRIATVGTTGNSPAGEHLHFMVYRSGSVIDPRAWLSGAGTSTDTSPGPTGGVGDREPSEPLPKPPRFKKGSGRSRPGLGDDTFTLDGKKLPADLEGLVTATSLDMAVEQVAQVTLAVLDPHEKLMRRDWRGSRLGWDGAAWDLSAQDISAAAATVNLAGRSRLARRMRRTYRVVGEHKVGPDEWTIRWINALGGKAVVEKTSKRGVLPESKDQSLWDALAGLCSDVGWSFVEYAGIVWAGSRMWAFQGGPNQPVWPVTWKNTEASDALDVVAALTDDDPDNRGSAEFTLRWDHGRRIRPWHLIDLTGLGVYDGLWLAESVQTPNDGTSVVQVSAARPRKVAQESSDPQSSSPPKGGKQSLAYAKWFAKKLLPKYGWGEAQWDPLEKLWTRESGWSWSAENPTSGAYGIPQSLPADKMASAGADWKTNPETQIRWGLSYIKGGYGSPARAWAHSQANNWY